MRAKRIGFDCAYRHGEPRFRFWYSDGFVEQVSLEDIIAELERIKMAQVAELSQ